jgi:hypothetical protein
VIASRCPALDTLFSAGLGVLTFGKLDAKSSSRLARKFEPINQSDISM